MTFVMWWVVTVLSSLSGGDAFSAAPLFAAITALYACWPIEAQSDCRSQWNCVCSGYCVCVVITATPHTGSRRPVPACKARCWPIGTPRPQRAICRRWNKIDSHIIVCMCIYQIRRVNDQQSSVCLWRVGRLWPVTHAALAVVTLYCIWQW